MRVNSRCQYPVCYCRVIQESRLPCLSSLLICPFLAGNLRKGKNEVDADVSQSALLFALNPLFILFNVPSTGIDPIFSDANAEHVQTLDLQLINDEPKAFAQLSSSNGETNEYGLYYDPHASA